MRGIASWVFATAVLLGMTACVAPSGPQTTGQYIDDVSLTARVKTALIEDPATKARNIDVDTYKGVVQLSGFVDSAEERTRAERVVSGVAGVVRVENRLALR
jgi:hyperosmotically inducible periplasmic protein